MLCRSDIPLQKWGQCYFYFFLSEVYCITKDCDFRSSSLFIIAQLSYLRGPVTKTNQSDYSTALLGQFSLSIGPGTVSNDPALSLLKMFCSFMPYVSERTGFCIKYSYIFPQPSFPSVLFGS